MSQPGLLAMRRTFPPAGSVTREVPGTADAQDEIAIARIASNARAIAGIRCPHWLAKTLSRHQVAGRLAKPIALRDAYVCVAALLHPCAPPASLIGICRLPYRFSLSEPDIPCVSSRERLACHLHCED